MRMHTLEPKLFTGFTIDISKQGSFQTYDLENQFHKHEWREENDPQILILGAID